MQQIETARWGFSDTSSNFEAIGQNSTGALASGVGSSAGSEEGCCLNEGFDFPPKQQETPQQALLNVLGRHLLAYGQ